MSTQATSYQDPSHARLTLCCTLAYSSSLHLHSLAVLGIGIDCSHRAEFFPFVTKRRFSSWSHTVPLIQRRRTGPENPKSGALTPTIRTARKIGRDARPFTPTYIHPCTRLSFAPLTRPTPAYLRQLLNSLCLETPRIGNHAMAPNYTIIHSSLDRDLQ